MQTFCQWLIIVFMLIGFMGNTYTMFNGRAKIEPLGFPGFVGVLIIRFLAVLTLIGAGAFNNFP